MGRWGILSRPLRLSVAKSARLVIVLHKLHNFIIETSNFLLFPPYSGMDIVYHSDVADHMVQLQDECDTHSSLH